MTEPRPAFARLAVVGDLMTARLLVARLQSEGIEARVHGEGLGPYRLTVGELATTEIWVAEDRMPEAREVMLAAEISALDPSPVPERHIPVPVIALGALALLIVVVSRLLAAFG